MANRAASGRGRPRDVRIDEQVLTATLELLVEDGFPGTTIHAVARRSGVHTSAIYRRWPSRIKLIEDAIGPRLDHIDLVATGNLREDVRRLVQRLAEIFGTPAARAALPGLIANYQQTDGPRPEEEWLRLSVRPILRDILSAAPETEVDPNLDPDDVFDMVLGILFARIYIPTVVDRQLSIERVAELVMRLVRP